MPTNHNQQPANQTELSPEELGVLSIDKINEWRTKQTEFEISLHQSAENNIAAHWQAREDAREAAGDLLEEYLSENGIDANSPNYAEVRALFSEASIYAVDRIEWGNSPASRGVDPNDHETAQEVFSRRISDRISSSRHVATDNGSAEQAPDTIEEVRNRVAELRDAWAKAASKRLGQAFSLKSKERDALKSDYHASVQELGRLELSDILEDDTMSELDKNVAVITFLFEEQNKLRAKTLENLKSTKVSRFVEWMNTGGVAKRIAKGVMLGTVAGVAGGVLAGAAGAGVIAAGAIAGSRFVKGYAAKDRHRGSKLPEKLDDVDAQNSEDTKLMLEHINESESADLLEVASYKVNEFFDDDVKDEQNERKKALAMGMASVAIGAGLGYAVTNIGALADAKDAVSDRVSGWVNGQSMDSGDVSRAPSGSSGWSDYLNDLSDKAHNLENHVGDVANQVDPETHAGHINFNPEHIPLDARWVEPGEGWYQTFQELGIPEDHWADVLQDAGPKLHDQDWAYFDNAHQEWRISQPGRLPNSALQTIADAAKRDGYTIAA